MKTIALTVVVVEFRGARLVNAARVACPELPFLLNGQVPDAKYTRKLHKLHLSEASFSTINKSTNEKSQM